MIPMIDLMMVTVSFLLITAVWSTMGRMEASANVPSPRDDLQHPAKIEPRVHVELHADRAPVVSVRESEVVLDTRALEREDELAKVVTELWHKRGEHQDPRDPKRDTIVLHADDGVTQGRIVAAMDAIASVHKSARERALDVVFSSR